jgi:hypothetical protein
VVAHPAANVAAAARNSGRFIIVGGIAFFITVPLAESLRRSPIGFRGAENGVRVYTAPAGKLRRTAGWVRALPLF